MSELSNDAQVLLTSWFLNGHKTTVEVGGAHAKSRLTERAKAALAELEAAGFITSRPFNDSGRMVFQGTEKRGKRMSLAQMEVHGAWSPTEPNPGASAAAKDQPTATLHLRSGATP